MHCNASIKGRGQYVALPSLALTIISVVHATPLNDSDKAIKAKLGKCWSSSIANLRICVHQVNFHYTMDTCILECLC